MEPLSGLEFVKRLRLDPENPYRLVPVIMITAFAELETVANPRDAGVSEFMAKPISADTLDNPIQRVLRTRAILSRPRISSARIVGVIRKKVSESRTGEKHHRLSWRCPIQPL